MPSVTLEDGTIIDNVPEGTDVKHLQANYDAYMQFKDHLVEREGDKKVSYKDSLGKLTGGIGHLLTDEEAKLYPEGTEIPEDVREQWIRQDMKKAWRAAKLQRLD